MANHRLPIAWLVASSVICTWDALFVILRPRTLEGGDLHFIWRPYAIYTQVDKRYGDMNDPFVLAQSWQNLFECLLNVVTVALLMRRKKTGLLLGFLVCAFTTWKTVTYMLQYTELCGGSQLIAHTTWQDYVFLFVLPSGIWLVLPPLVGATLGKDILRLMGKNKME
eukprot:Em0018g669a